MVVAGLTYYFMTTISGPVVTAASSLFKDRSLVIISFSFSLRLVDPREVSESSLVTYIIISALFLVLNLLGTQPRLL